MKVKYNFHALFLIILVFNSCTKTPEKAVFTEEISAIKNQFAPDKRVALFNITTEKSDDIVVLKGESNMAEAIDALKEKLSISNYKIIDSIQLLPSKKLKNKTNAVVNISVANLRSNPKHSAELATQATLGTPVKVLKKEGEWFYIQTPDNYLSWVDDGGITLMDDTSFEKWKTSDKIIYTKTYGHSYSTMLKKEIVSDLVAGAVLKLEKADKDYFEVSYPDGRKAIVDQNEAKNYLRWINELNTTEEDLVSTSKTLMGTPYLWGGTSTKGMDCSGFTKTVYFLNGMIIPRDASQQVHTGKQIDENQNFENLKRGDLLFFGRKATDTTKEKVVHVGMWIGNHEFIHASNMVRVSSINPEAPNFDAHNLNRYLRSKRILKEADKDLIDLKQVSLFKK